MQRKRNPLNLIATAVVFLALETAAIVILRSNSELQRSWFGYMGQSTMKVLWGGSERIKDYFRLKSCNDSLANENHLLLKENARLNAVIEAEALSEVAKGSDSRFIHTGACIIKMSRNRQHNYLILDKGSKDGIREGSGIITRRGVIGIVEAVSENYCYCISFLNRDMNISARLRRDGPVGSLVWDGMSRAELKEIPHHLMTELGDTVYTSGFSTIFPKDIPVGVTVSSRLKDGATWDLEVEFLEDFSRLKYVTVVTNRDFEEIDNLKKEGGHEQE